MNSTRFVLNKKKIKQGPKAFKFVVERKRIKKTRKIKENKYSLLTLNYKMVALMWGYRV